MNTRIEVNSLHQQLQMHEAVDFSI